MSLAKHQKLAYNPNSSYDNHVDPSTRLPFELGEHVVFCPDKNSLISLRSLQAIGYQCPFCGLQLDTNLGVVGKKELSESGKKIPTATPPISSPSPGLQRTVLPAWSWIGLFFVFCFMLSVGAIAITRVLQGGTQTVTPTVLFPQDDNSESELVENANVSSSQPTEPPLLPVDDDKWIVFAYGSDQVGDSGSNTGRDLYLINWKTDEQRQLTSGNSGDNFPSFAADGERLVFTGCRPECQLYILNVKTGTEEKIPGISVKAMAPKWCPAKPWIVFEARQNSNRQISLWMIDLTDNNITTLTKGPADSRPVWSPDCSKILFGRALKDTNRDGVVTTNDRLDMYIYDMASQSTESILETPDADEFGYSWSPTENLIAFTRVSEDTDGNGQITLDDHSDLFLYDMGTGRERNLTQGSYSAFSPSFSFDGNFIVFTAYEGFSNRIVVYSVLDSSFTNVSGLGDYYHASWKP